jgi:hypothetical protein
MKLFAIRHKPSGTLMPALRRGRGYTSLNFHANGYADAFTKGSVLSIPRLFPSRIAAQRALAGWLKGEWEREYERDDYGGGEIVVGAGPPPTPPADRKPEDMEIAMFRLSPERTSAERPQRPDVETESRVAIKEESQEPCPDELDGYFGAR